jgi:DNA-binding FadR family transcriptional regulator
MITARSLIEPWAASVVAQLADRASVVAELRRLTDEATDALARGDDSAFQEADRAFHHRVLTAAGNRILTSFYSSLRDRQMRSGTLALRSNPQRGTETMAQHTAITDAIASGDAAHAAVVAAAHVDSTAAALGLSSAPSANSSNTGYRTDVR